MPRYQVIRFQVIAASSVATTATWVASCGSTSPAPTVFATAVPVSAPSEVERGGHQDRLRGLSTRVATTVAMAFAVSWKPLMKSKMTARISDDRQQ